jgi:CheY-like chemotaxis protein
MYSRKKGYIYNMKTIQILLVEDNPADIYLAKEALKESDVPVQLHVVEDGVKAINFLLKKAPYESVDTPHVILLDLKLPIKDGLEVLEEIRLHPGLKRVPVVVITSSEHEKDISRTFSLDATCYITKPIDPDQLISTIKLVNALPQLSQTH